MFCTDASIPFGYFFEDLLIMPLHVVVLSDDVDVDVAVADMTIAKNELAGFSQVVSQDGPFLYVKTNVIRQDFSLVSGQHCHILPHLPDLLELNIIIGQNGILNLNALALNGLKQLLKPLTWGLNKQQVILLLDSL